MKKDGNGSQGQKYKTNNEISIDMESSIIETGSDSQERRENNNDSSPEASIKMKLDGLPPVYPQCCIFRVPEKFRGHSDESYTPRVASIGPYHHKKRESLKAMEDQKLRYVRNFLRHNRKTSVQGYLEAIDEWRDKIHQYYEERIDMEQNAFNEMIFVDSIFIIQLFLLHHNKEWIEPTDRVFNKPWMLHDVLRGIKLLENQLPFFVIEGLYNLAFGFQQKPSLLDLACGFFRQGEETSEFPQKEKHAEPRHFLDIIRLSHLPCVRKAPNPNGEMSPFIPTATKLVAAGVKLRKAENKRIFSMTFKNGILEIPCLQLYSMSESYFKNMIAFEHLYCQDDSYLIDYFNFFDNLVNTPDDAGLLIEKGIIENWLGNDDAVAHQLNSFCKGTFPYTSNAYFFHLRQHLNKYYQRRRNKWKASLKRDYFTSPWAAISLFAAIILLTLTVIQTACSIIQTK